MINDKYIILDGAMGTILQKAGLPAGYPPELWNLEQPELITEIGKKYIEAGSGVIYANTFGANRRKLKGVDIAELIFAGVSAAKRAAKETDAKVALDIGPIGELLEPLGKLSFDEAYDIFKEMLIAGEKAGADIVVFETMSDLYELKAGILAAKENTKLPVWATMTFEENERSFLGVTIPAMALTLTALGAEAIGFNCSLGPKELVSMAEELSKWTDLPIILKPNAGLPNPESGEYGLSASGFAEELSRASEHGATIFGGCCGTTPEFIRELSRVLSNKENRKRNKKLYGGICSASNTARFGGTLVIGERINPTGKKKFRQALIENNISYILEQGIQQKEAGADILDVNLGLPGIDEASMMKAVVKQLQSTVDLPLQIDSSDVSAIEAALRYYNGKPILNSVNGDIKTLDRILPLCKKYGAALVGLTMDSEGIPKTAEERIEIAGRIVKKAEEYGIPREDVIIDCLTLTVSAQQEAAKETLSALRYVREKMGLHTTLGVSNISFGLPMREKITAAFLAEALACGLDMPIINPNSAPVMELIHAHRALSGEDKGCNGYIERFANAPEKKKEAPASEMSIESAILRGLKDETAELTKKALAYMEEIAVVNELLIPALDAVGERYERQEIFLPQLLNSANAACAGFEIIKEAIAKKGGSEISKGKIIVASVKGDIHDIGKNIVKVVLENYGYTVIDLGRDVPPEVIVREAIERDVRLIGLSALMTTTVGSMKETIRAIRESGHECRIWAGGAVLTPEYAKEIGADFYAKDAKESVDIARNVLG